MKHSCLKNTQIYENPTHPSLVGRGRERGHFRMKYINFLLLIMFICVSCRIPDFDTRLLFANNYDKAVYVGLSDMESDYKDTAYVYINYSIVNYDNRYKFYSDTVKEFLLYIPWEKLFEYGKRDTVSFYIFDATLLETTSWKKVREDYLVLQRYDLSLQNMKDLNWTLYFPPTEAMKDMKMYPPYGN
jgi:hypothetical protein